ncbi:SGNH/GDSL hydrolase family protein [Pedobacter frigoris]|uniref:SGNH/GDSL hydrolase family protein n=1 Tax=Pedobacter frigoris TaxID=2571272 RepID=A0A4V5NZR9_9SPHI|nr:SGNH/GDSL hydrolase family protein [Pedobacter frigoris]TKC09572.1 SGNH/GDSL hydrolase family protein [Pedobacter frigoris]
MKLLRLLFCLSLSIAFNADAQVKIIPFHNYVNVRGGINHSYYTFTIKKKATVAFLGGSITYNEGWRNKVCNYLKDHYPETNFRFITAGIPSLGSLPYAFRLKNDVLDSGKIDLLFLEAAVNDETNGTDSVVQVKALEGIIRHARKSNPSVDIIMMSFADPGKTRTYDEGKIPTSVANHELVAAHYRLPSINLAKAVRDKLKNAEFDWIKDFKDLHPSPFGQELYFSAIKELFAESEKVFRRLVMVKRHSKLPKPLSPKNFSEGDYFDIKLAEYNEGWKMDNNWNPQDHIDTRAGFVNVPVLSSVSLGAVLKLKFKGTAVGMAILSGPDAGIVNYRIDNGPEKQVDLFTQ